MIFFKLNKLDFYIILNYKYNLHMTGSLVEK